MLQHTWTKCNTTAQCRDHVCCSTRSHQAHWWHQTASTLMRMSAHTHARTCTHVDVDAHTHVYTRIEGHANTDIDAHVHTHACTSCPNAVCMHVYVSTGVLVTRARTHARTHARAVQAYSATSSAFSYALNLFNFALTVTVCPALMHARTHARAHVRTCARMHAGKNSATPSSSVDLCPHCHGVDMCADICTDMCVLLAVYCRSQVHGGRRSCCMPVACRMPRAACRHTTLPLQTCMSHVACHVSYL